MVRQVKRVTDDENLQEGIEEYLMHDGIPLEAETHLRLTINEISRTTDSLEDTYSEIFDTITDLAEPRWEKTFYTASPPDIMDECLIGDFAYEAHSYLESTGLSREDSAEIVNAAIREDLTQKK